ncbi:hypothetical protein RCL_jg8187.t1 [Rhizophagus clarus]|uniref:Uncharacterized protein n=1 Tax=Rhizophagus clarus TaxID=94130 RepID=A0A8H3M921_9GLOM|nr:hypothetical protein RCL_jg8187.t1 [Rhizophagus clarus]
MLFTYLSLVFADPIVILNDLNIDVDVAIQKTGSGGYAKFYKIARNTLTPDDTNTWSRDNLINRFLEIPQIFGSLGRG